MKLEVFAFTESGSEDLSNPRWTYWHRKGQRLAFISRSHWWCVILSVTFLHCPSQSRHLNLVFQIFRVWLNWLLLDGSAIVFYPSALLRKNNINWTRSTGFLLFQYVLNPTEKVTIFISHEKTQNDLDFIKIWNIVLCLKKKKNSTSTPFREYENILHLCSVWASHTVGNTEYGIMSAARRYISQVSWGWHQKLFGGKKWQCSHAISNVQNSSDESG